MKIKIGVLAHYSALEHEFKHLEESLGCELIFRRGVLDFGIEPAIEMEQKLGVHAIIGTSKTVETIQEYVSVPVIPFPKAPYSLILAFYEAKKLGSRIAFVDTVSPEGPYDYEKIAAIVGCNVHGYLLTSADDSDKVVRQILDDGHDVLVTSASCTIARARNYGMQYVRVKIDTEDFIATVNSAVNMVRIKDAEVRRAGYMRTVVNASATATFSLDDEDRVNIVNRRAEEMLGISEQNLLGRTLPELAKRFPLFDKIIRLETDLDMIKANDVEVVVIRKELVAADGRHIGMIYHFQDPNSVRQRELFVRKRAHEKGFVASATFESIRGSSDALQKTINQAKKYASTQSSILINGESGSGKEIFAQSIHNYSPYSSGPFVALNCAALPENLLESELFGYEEGAFTGAKKGGKIGLFEHAHNGTLFLDEIGELPLILQSKLLRVLQERQFRRVGGEKIIPIDVRIICATNRNLWEAVSEGTFRADLLYRINVLSLDIPPLRQRREDIGPLAQYFAEYFAAKNNSSFRFSAASSYELEQYDWPGNVRELRNFVERLVVLSDQNLATPEMVRETLKKPAVSPVAVMPEEDSGSIIKIPLGTKKEMELEMIRQVYNITAGDKKVMERTLDVSDTTLWRILKKIQVE